MPAFRATSSNIQQIEHDGQDNGTLTVTFKTGRVYRYDGVPIEHYVALRDAQEHPEASVGKRFNQLIRNVFDYEEVV